MPDLSPEKLELAEMILARLAKLQKELNKMKRDFLKAHPGFRPE